MAKGKLFEYAVLYHPKQKAKKEGEEEAPTKKSQLIVEPTRVVAVTDQEVAILAARGIPNDYLDKLEDVEVIIRPFA